MGNRVPTCQDERHPSFHAREEEWAPTDHPGHSKTWKSGLGRILAGTCKLSSFGGQSSTVSLPWSILRPSLGVATVCIRLEELLSFPVL